jgi:Predicted endonuclease involved in recombination (possible Holliday junction resolvase in Mycoplasmas and B. subtilis)
MLAHPLETIASASPKTVAQRLQKIVAERQVDCVVVGLPRQMNGALGPAAKMHNILSKNCGHSFPAKL